MPFYRNTTQGARAIHLANGTRKLVEAGATVFVEEGKLLNRAPGLVECADPSSEVPDVPEDLVEAVEKQEAETSATAPKAKAAPRKKAATKKTAAKP